MSDDDVRPPDVPRVADLEAPLTTPAEVALVVFDFDGTLAEQRGSWGLLYRLFGVEDRGDDRTERFWNDDLTFQSWCEGNVADWRAKDVTRENLRRAARAVKLTTGTERLLAALTEQAVPFGVLSSGVADLIARIDTFDPAFVASNEVQYDDGVPVGVDARVGPFDKGEILREICERRGINPGDTLYVGDSHSDTEAFDEAGLAVLFDPDDRIAAEDYALVDVVVEERDLSLVGDIIGLRTG